MTQPEPASEGLTGLISELRRNGYHISLQQHIAAQRLLVTLAALGDWRADPRRLGPMLAPVLCTSRDEQNAFPQFYEQWWKSCPGLFKFDPEPDPLPPSPEPDETSGKKPEDYIHTSRIRPWVWSAMPILVMIVLIALAIIFGIFSRIDIRGIVTDLQDNPLSKASVTHQNATTTNPNGILPTIAKTGEDGNFEISVSKKTPLLDFGKEGYKSTHYQVTNPDEFIHVRLEPGRDVEGESPPPIEPTFLEKIWFFLKSHEALVWANIACLLSAAGLYWWGRHRHDVELKKWRTEKQPALTHLEVTGTAGSHRQFSSLRRTAQELRRHRQTAVQDLDVEQTVAATIRQGGVLTPVYKYRKSLPEYLVLIDQAGFKDQQARWINELMGRLDENKVFLAIYFFRGDPRICRENIPKAPFQNLAGLAAKYPEHDLLIFSDGDGFFDPLTGDPQPWLDQFSAWPTRALLTPEFQADDYRGRAMAEQGFRVLPAGKTGLEALNEMIYIGLPYRVQGGKPIERLPALLRQRPGRWLEDYPPMPDTLNEVRQELKRFLGAEGYFWLSACAIYPLLSWDMTLHIGHVLGIDQHIIDQQFPHLLRLPWFRNGSMPDWLRKRLIWELPRDQEQSIRDKLLKPSPDNPEGFILPLAHGPQAEGMSFLKRAWQKLIAGASAPQKTEFLLDDFKSEPEDSPLHDYVLISFLSGRKPNRLGVTLPDELRDALYPAAKPGWGSYWARTRAWLKAAPMAQGEESKQGIYLARALIIVNLIVAAGLLPFFWGATDPSTFVAYAVVIVPWVIFNIAVLSYIIHAAEGVSATVDSAYVGGPVPQTFPNIQGQWRAALQKLVSAVAPPEPVDAKECYERGNSYANRNQYEQAIRYHEEAIQQEPGNSKFRCGLGDDYAWLGQWKEAIKYYEEAAYLRPDDAEAWSALGNALLFLARYEEASASLQKALAFNPHDARSLSNLGYLHMIYGRRDEAVKAFKQSIAEDSERPNPYYLWGRLLYRDKQYTLAAEKFRQALRVDPESLAALLSLPAISRLIEPPGNSVWKRIDRLVEAETDPMIKAQWLALTGSAGQAIEKLAEAIQVTPDSAVYAPFCPAFHKWRRDARFITLIRNIPGAEWEDSE